MREDVEGAGDRIMLWYGGLAVGNKQLIDSKGEIDHVVERRRELLSRLANVNRELATLIAERLTNVSRHLGPPVTDVLSVLDVSLNQLIALGQAHGTEVDRIADAMRRSLGYAVEVLGYPPKSIGDSIFHRTLERLARVRAAATEPSPPAAAKPRNRS